MKKILLAFIFFFLNPLLSFSFDVKLRGYVTTQDNKPVVGASIYIENSFIKTVTDQKGFFELTKVPRKPLVVVVSMIGMKTIKDTVEFSETTSEVELAFIMEESPIQFGGIVVTASKNEKIYDEVPIKTSLMDSKHFACINVQNIREALLFQPGVRTEVNCQNCGFSQVRINGLEGKYSQILLDGKPILSSLNGVYGLEQIPTNMIERIEVIRGGGSSLYGGNAIAGVVNVITKKPLFNSYSFSLNNILVSKNSKEQTLNLFGTIVSKANNYGLSVFGTFQRRDEYDANGDGFSEIGRLKLKMLGLKNEVKIDANHKLSFELHTISHSIRGGNKLDEPPHQSDICEMAEHDTYVTQLVYDYVSFSASKFSAMFGFQSTKRNSYYGANQDINAYGDTRNKTISISLNYSNFFNLFGTHFYTIGYDFFKDIMKDRAPAYGRIIEQNVWSNGVFFQDDWTIGSLVSLLWGFRIEKHNLISKFIFNPRSSLMLKFNNDIILRTTYSTGYRAPQAFDEDLHITQVGGEGLVLVIPKELKPEYSNSLSFSIDFSLIRFRIPFAVSLEFFYTKLINAFTLVDLGSNSNGERILERRNAKGSFVGGTTFEIQSTLTEEFFFKMGLTLQQSKYLEKINWSLGDSSNGIEPQYSDKILKSPSIYGFFLFSYFFNDLFNIDISGNFNGPMYIPHYAGFITKDELVKTPSFLDLNVTLSYKVFSSPEINFSFGINNILNHYQKDFDFGINRDANYIYGPFRPRNMFARIEVNV